MQALETIVIVVALASFWPLIIGYPWAAQAWYKFGCLGLVLLAMAWVTVQRVRRIRAAAEEAKRRRDEAARSGRPPWLPG
jgi:hypothetical protein